MATATVDQEKIEMSAAQIIFNSVDLGAITGGVVFSYTKTVVPIEIDQTNMVERHRITAQACSVTASMSEWNLTLLQHAFSPGTFVLDSGAVKKKIEIGGDQIAQDLSDYAELVITPILDGSATLDTNANLKITIFKAIVTSGIDINFSKDAQRVIPVTFEGIRDSTKSAGKQLFLIGDSTATA
ncbi:hypothetical protein LCGC14_1575980 [marine sediment metagenome]|uniref:Uncharacterized protein n=1 Tax=marine sediment metagenome TaxID=412755 RepID=A0A0F9IIE0_9ZZZZ